MLTVAGPAQTGVRLGDSSVKQLSNTGRVDVVIVAHADDWQLFMGDAIVDRVRAGRRPVFIYLTAGDHGRDSVYWRLFLRRNSLRMHSEADHDV